MNELNFETKIEREFGQGVSIRGLEQAKKNVQNKRKTAEKWSKQATIIKEKLIFDKNNKNLQLELKNIEDEFRKATDDWLDAKKSLSTGDVFGKDAPAKNMGFVPCDGEISLADLYDIRFTTDGETARILVENYNESGYAEVVDEGESAKVKDALDYINTVNTDRTSIKKLVDILSVPESIFYDDPNLFEAIDSVQEKHMKNTENALLCQVVRNSKTPIKLTNATLPTFGNDSLCARAKRNAEIITNESGFEKLDICDAEGNRLLKKDFTIGEFIFADKYIVRTLSDDILPNNEDGTAPLFLGDWKSILRIAIVKTYPPLVNNDVFRYRIENRVIEHIIPLLTTTSDKAFVVGVVE